MKVIDVYEQDFIETPSNEIPNLRAEFEVLIAQLDASMTEEERQKSNLISYLLDKMLEKDQVVRRMMAKLTESD